MIKKTFYILVFSLSVCLQSCLKDIESPASSISIDHTAILLQNLESPGAYISNDPSPVLINANELYENSDFYLILDFRTQDDFNTGHIKDAVNISSANLLSYLEKNNIREDNKIACVDANGQSSAYYAALLRLYGYYNAYSLNFGMASWNSQFAGTWKAVIKSNVWHEMKFTDAPFPKNSFTPLPANGIPEELSGPDEKIKYRINQLLNIGFVDTLNEFNDSMILHNYVFCYGSTSLYICGSRSSYPDQGHPMNTPLYIPGRDLYPAYALQTIPSNYPSIIYCYNGQLSAITLAYLRILGYNVKTLLYGAEYLFHDRMAGDQSLAPYLFTSLGIRHYPVVK